MKFFVKVSEFCDLNDSRENKKNQLLHALQNEWSDAVSDPDSYLAIDCCTDDDFVFGTDAPRIICEAAEKWNNEIETRLYNAINSFQESGCSNALCELEKAVMAANDTFYLFGYEAILIPDEETGTYWLHPRLHDDQYGQIMERSEEFALVEVTVK